MTDLSTLTKALLAGDYDAVLVGTKYAKSTKGIWKVHHSDSTTNSDIKVGYRLIGMTVFHRTKREANTSLLIDSKANAAKVVVYEAAIKALSADVHNLLSHLAANFHDKSSCWVELAEITLTATSDLQKMMEASHG